MPPSAGGVTGLAGFIPNPAPGDGGPPVLVQVRLDGKTPPWGERRRRQPDAPACGAGRPGRRHLGRRRPDRARREDH